VRPVGKKSDAKYKGSWGSLDISYSKDLGSHYIVKHSARNG